MVGLYSLCSFTLCFGVRNITYFTTSASRIILAANNRIEEVHMRHIMFRVVVLLIMVGFLIFTPMQESKVKADSACAQSCYA